MAEDKNKKDSFTFSDKIKETKPSPVPFAKRFSASRVGSDGKPRQTFFERTKRDAPFFIAALIVLLLLPFFIKFTGTGIDDSDIIVRDPFATVSDGGAIYDMCLDENGQIIDGCVAGASGRDSIDMLRDAIAMGQPKAEPAPIYTPSPSTERETSRSAYTSIRETAPATVAKAMPAPAAPRQPTAIGNLKAGYRQTGYDCDMVGTFHSDCELTNRLFEKAARTLYVCMRDNFMDCPDRERGQWIGDVSVQAPQALLLLSGQARLLLKKCIKTLSICAAVMY